MRRVWRLYLWSIVVNPATAAGVVAVLSAVAFAQLVFIEQVVHNLLATNLGQLPAFAVSALTHADIPSLVAFAVLCVSTLWGIRLVSRLSSLAYQQQPLSA